MKASKLEKNSAMPITFPEIKFRQKKLKGGSAIFEPSGLELILLRASVSFPICDQCYKKISVGYMDGWNLPEIQSQM